MGTWRYGIVKMQDGSFVMSELFMDDDGQVEMMSEPITDTYETVDDLIDDLEMLLEDAQRYPVFLEPEEWEEPDWLKDLSDFAGAGVAIEDFLSDLEDMSCQCEATCHCGKGYPYLN